MSTFAATWEDDENNRQVQFSVDYTTENGAVEIESITPNQVNFVCPTSKNTTRTMGVWTAKGADHLRSKIATSGVIENVKTQIAERDGMTLTV